MLGGKKVPNRKGVAHAHEAGALRTKWVEGCIRQTGRSLTGVAQQQGGSEHTPVFWPHRPPIDLKRPAKREASQLLPSIIDTFTHHTTSMRAASFLGSAPDG
jgi:hypothetical protein